MTTKRQHFVPQAYLKGFSEVEGEAFIWVYDKREGRRPKRGSVREFAHSEYYYEQETQDGSRDLDTLEKTFARTIDNELPLLIKNIKIEKLKWNELDDQDKGKLAYFIGLMLTRGPSFRDGAEEMYLQIANIIVNNSPQTDKAIIEALNSSAINLTVKPWVSLKPMLDLALQIAESTLSKNWLFYVAADNVPFITSDNPVVISGRGCIGPAHPLAELLIPLRKDLALVCTPRGLKHQQLFKQASAETKTFNRAIARAAHQRVFASIKSDGINRLVKKYTNDHQHFTVR